MSRTNPPTTYAVVPPRPFDLPWIVLDHAKATRLWHWQPATPAAAVLEEIAAHAESHPDWLERSAPF